MSTLLERIETEKKKVFQQAQQRKLDGSKSFVHLTKEEEFFAKETISLVSNPAFKTYLQFLAGIRAGLLSNPYEKSAYCKRDNFEYTIGFNEGFLKGILYVTHEVDRVWKSYLSNLESKKGDGNEDEKS